MSTCAISRPSQAHTHTVNFLYFWFFPVWERKNRTNVVSGRQDRVDWRVIMPRGQDWWPLDRRWQLIYIAIYRRQQTQHISPGTHTQTINRTWPFFLSFFPPSHAHRDPPVHVVGRPVFRHLWQSTAQSLWFRWERLCVRIAYSAGT